MTSGTTFNLQQFSTEDGPGIRTTVFLKGCPLHCVWCHNPEGLSPKSELMWYDVRCIASRHCLQACSLQALQLNPGGVKIDRIKCTACGDCVTACPTAALEIIGRRWEADDLLNDLIKDKVFYETSGGGVTFSGGEPVAQSDFLAELLPRCSQAGLHTALDTCGALPWERYQVIMPWIDLVLLDLKLIDPGKHRLATGMDNYHILDNAKKISHLGKTMWIRTPIIPGYTDAPENIRSIGKFILQNLPTVERWDLLAYTNLGRPKYHRLDRPYPLEDLPLLTEQEMQSVFEIAAQFVPQVKWSGATRSEQMQPAA